MKLARMLAAVLLATAFRTAAAAAGLTVVSEGPNAPQGERALIVRSARLGRDLRVVVSAPGGPLVAAGRKLPAIYALDGGYGVAGPMGQMMAWGVAMSPAYIVEVGYPEKNGDTAGRWRNTDLLFRETDVEGRLGGGGAAAFETFLTEELKPFLEARYPLDPSRAILFGHSFGGLFAANVLARAPQSFAGYIIASPSVWADPGVTQALVAAAPRAGAPKVFLAVGGAEEPRMSEGFAAIGAALATPGAAVQLEKRIFAGQTHIGYYPQLVAQAYAWILPPPAAGRVTRVAVALSAKDLGEVAGTYLIGDGRKIDVTVNEGRLYAQMTGSPGGEILAEGARRFFAPIAGFDVTLTFEGPPGRPATAVVVSLNGAKTLAVRKP